MLKSNTAPTDLPSGGFPWKIFAAIFVLSAPLWLFAGMYRLQLMPGLPISALMFLTCPLAACVFTWRSGGGREVGRLVARTCDFWRFSSPVWYAAAFLLMPGALVATYFVMRTISMPLPDPEIAWLDAPVLLCLFLFAAACEELAWSGTVLEPLQARWGKLPAAVLIGVVSAVWHVVPYAQASNTVNWIVGQCLFTVVLRVVIVEFYNLAGRSLFATIAIHASYNVAWQLFPNRGSGYDPWVASAVTTVVAVILVRYAREQTAAE